MFQPLLDSGLVFGINGIDLVLDDRHPAYCFEAFPEGVPVDLCETVLVQGVVEATASMEEAAFMDSLGTNESQGYTLLPIADQGFGWGWEALFEPLGDHVPAISHADVEDLQLALGREAAHHQPDIRSSGIMAGPLQLDLGSIGHLIGAGLGTTLMAEVGHRIDLIGKALEAAVQGGVAGGGALWPHAVQRLDALAERLDQGQTVPGQEAILSPADVGRQVQGLPERHNHPPFIVTPQLEHRHIHPTEWHLPGGGLTPFVPVSAGVPGHEIHPDAILDGLERAPEKLRGRHSLKLPEGQGQGLKQTICLAHADLEGQLDPQDLLVLHGGSSRSEGSPMFTSFLDLPPTSGQAHSFGFIDIFLKLNLESKLFS